MIEPTFGIGRILITVLEHGFKIRDEKRTYLCLKPRIAPVKETKGSIPSSQTSVTMP